MVYDIVNFLESKGIQVSKFTTKKPDLTFEINSKRFAIEVETGKLIEKKKPQIIEKIKLLKENYDDWYFVVCDKKFVQRYRKLGKTIEKRYLANCLNKILKNAKISPLKNQTSLKSCRRTGAFSGSKKPPTIIDP